MHKAVAILLTKNSMNAVVESLPFNGKPKFAWACLNIPNQGQNWYFVSINPANPGIVDYNMQVMSELMLDDLFEFDTPANATFWFPVILRKK